MKKKQWLVLSTLLLLAGCAADSADIKTETNGGGSEVAEKEETKKEGLLVKKTAYLSKTKEEVGAALPMAQLVEDAGDFAGVYKGTFSTTVSSLGSNREDDGVLEVHKDGSFTLYRLELKDGGGVWSDMDIWTGYLSQEFGEYGMVFVDKGTFTPETTEDKKLVFDSIKNPILGLDAGEPVLDDDLLFAPKDGAVTIRSKGNKDTKMWLDLEKADGKEVAVAIGWPELKSAYQVQDEIKLHAGDVTEVADNEKAGMSEEERLLADIQGFWYDTGANRYITITEDNFQTVPPIAQGVVERFITEGIAMQEYRVDLVDTETNTVQLLIKNPLATDESNTSYVTMQFDGENPEAALGLAGPNLVTASDNGTFFEKWVKVADKDNITVEAFESFNKVKSEKGAVSGHEPVFDLPLDSPFYDYTFGGRIESSYFGEAMKGSLELLGLGHVVENSPDKASLFITNPAYTTAAKLIANGEATPDDEQVWEYVVRMIWDEYRIRNADGAQELDVYIADGYPNFSRVLWFKGDMRDLLTADSLQQNPMTEKEMEDALFGYWADTEQDVAHYVTKVDYGNDRYGEHFVGEPTLEEVTAKMEAWQARESLPNHNVTYFPKSGIIQFWANYNIHRIDLTSGSDSHLVGIYSNVLSVGQRDFQVASWSRVAGPDATAYEIAEVIQEVMLDDDSSY